MKPLWNPSMSFSTTVYPSIKTSDKSLPKKDFMTTYEVIFSHYKTILTGSES